MKKPDIYDEMQAFTEREGHMLRDAALEMFAELRARDAEITRLREALKDIAFEPCQLLMAMQKTRGDMVQVTPEHYQAIRALSEHARKALR